MPPPGSNFNFHPRVQKDLQVLSKFWNDSAKIDLNEENLVNVKVGMVNDENYFTKVLSKA